MIQGASKFVLHQILLRYKSKEYAVGRSWEKWQSCIQYLFSKPEGKRPLGRPRLRQEDSIKIESVDWILLLQDRN
jgi:hypothetical protein